MNKIRVGVLFGGPSAEHEISVLSGKAILKNISKKKYDVIEIFIDKNRNWKIDNKKCNEKEALKYLSLNTDIIFIGLHGTFGEDGEVQRLFENAGIVFTGSGSKASKLAMDKDQASIIYKRFGIPVPNEQVLENDRNVNNPFGFPVVVKPVAQGSSVGVSIIESDDLLENAIRTAYKYDSKVLLQQFIKGREVSCGVIEDKNGVVEALPPTELIPINKIFFDYEAKYTPGATKEVTPPDLPPETIKKIQDYAVKAHSVLGCKDYSRTDMIIADDDIYIIETNTLPGMTATSILPQQAKVAGMSFSSMIDRIINAGLHKKKV